MNSTNNHKQQKVTLIGLVRIFAFITAILSIVTLFSEFHRLIELFSHFKLQYFLASSISAIIFLFHKEKTWAFSMLIGAAINLFFVLPWYVNTTSNTHPTLIPIKILHSNVQTSNENHQELIKLILTESPDILSVQEVNKTWISKLIEIEELLPHKFIRPREDNFGIAVYSKYPFDSSEFIYLGRSNIPSIKATLTIGEQPVTLISSHPVPPISENFYESRNSQLNALSLLSKEVDQPLIVIGDLNVTMWSHTYLALENETKLSNTREGFGILPTWPTNLLPLMIPIDHCLVSEEFDVLDMRVGDDVGSDHLPIIVDLKFRN